MGPVQRFLALVPWWRVVLLQDAPLRLQFEPNSYFLQKHRLFQHPVFRPFFNSILTPTVLAAHDEGERRCQQQVDHNPFKAQAATDQKIHQIEQAMSSMPDKVTHAVLAATQAKAGSKRGSECELQLDTPSPPAAKRLR